MDVGAKANRSRDGRRGNRPAKVASSAIERGTTPLALTGKGSWSDIFRSFGRRTDWLFAAGLVAAVFVVYFPCWHGGFLFDDDLHLLNNPVLKPGGLAKIWVPGGYINYWPITYTAYWIQYQLWGLQPLGYHLVNLALHALATILVWRVLVRLRVPGAMFATALFALHPVNVESVAWIAQLKGILSLVFALVSMLFYLSNERHPTRWRYGLAIVAFILSALSKGAAVSLPIILLACAWWQRGRIERRDLLRVLPYVLISALMAGIEMWGQRFVAQGDVVRSDDFFSRLAVAGCALWFYLGKLVWPAALSPFYPRWTIDESSVLSYLPGLAWIALLALAWWRRRTWGRPAVMLIVCYSALLLPVLGFVTITFMRYSLVADHWQYIATIVPLAVFAGVSTALARRFLAGLAIYAAAGAGAALLLALAILSGFQSQAYIDSDAFYETAIARNPSCWAAHDNLATTLFERGQTAAAIEHYHKAIEINPDRAEIYDNLAVVLAGSQQIDSAIPYFRKALEIKPHFAQAHFELGDALFRQGKVDLAIEQYQKAIDDKPDYTAAWCCLAAALAGRGQVEQAIADYHKALTISPDYEAAHCDLGKALAAAGRVDEAIAEYRRAIGLRPNYAEAHSNLATALARRGKIASAIDHFQKAIEIKPDYAEAHNNFGAALFAAGRIDAAIEQYHKSLAIKPEYAEAHCNLANALARRGELDTAIIEYEKALAIEPDYAAAREYLATVRSERDKMNTNPKR